MTLKKTTAEYWDWWIPTCRCRTILNVKRDGFQETRSCHILHRFSSWFWNLSISSDFAWSEPDKGTEELKSLHENLFVRNRERRIHGETGGDDEQAAATSRTAHHFFEGHSF